RRAVRWPLCRGRTLVCPLQDAAFPQSSGGNSTGQKCGDGFTNSNATPVYPPGGFTTRTTLAATSAPDTGLTSTIGCPASTSICNFSRPPCAFTTIVCVSSSIFSCSTDSVITTIGICNLTRSLRLLFSTWEGGIPLLFHARTRERQARRFAARLPSVAQIVLCFKAKGNSLVGVAASPLRFRHFPIILCSKFRVSALFSIYRTLVRCTCRIPAHGGCPSIHGA